MRFILCLALFAGIINVEAVVESVIESAARKEIKPLLAADISSVEVNGQSFAPDGQLIADIRNMSQPMGHHSHPIGNVQVTLNTAKGRLILYLGRDSGDPHEYWVFYPGFGATLSNAVGHVFTSVLDSIKV